MEGRKRFEAQSLKALVKVIFEKKGLTSENAAAVADVMIAADRMGIESHGIGRIGMYVHGIKIGRIQPTNECKILRETPVSALIDANDGMGHSVAIRAMKKAIEKAQGSGIGVVAVRNSNHFGIGGYYTELAARQKMLGLCMTNSEAMVVPTFGRRAMMGTNPIAVTMPADPTWFHFDISTSVVPAGKIEVYSRNRQSLPEGWSVGSDGKVNTDPDEFLKIRKEKLDGGLLPMGGFGMTHSGHKGYAISMLVEIMTGILAGGNTSDHVREVPNIDRCCHFFMAIDYGMFGDKRVMEAHLATYLQAIRDSAKADGHDRIMIQGELEADMKKKTDKLGIPLHDQTYGEIVGICEDLGIDYASIMVEKPRA